jgi:cell division septation protein DedD
MTDIRANDPALDDDDRLPWLEAVEEDDKEEGPSAAKLIASVVIALIVIGLVVGGIFWMQSNTRQPGASGGGEPEMIAAPDGDYKVKPGDPGGMQVEGKGDTTFAASEGADPKGVINTDAAPEAPVKATRPPAQAQPQAQTPTSGRPQQQAQAAPPRTPTPTPTPTPAPAPAPAPAAPAAGGASVQLGAFSSQAAANSAWKALSGRFKYLEPLSHSVVSAQVGGKTVYRLRASGADAKALCGRLRVAGESCVQVN